MRPALRSFALPVAASLLLLLHCASLPAQPANWKPFSSLADGFKAQFPADPEMSKSSVPVGGNTYELHSYVAEVGATALYVGVCDYGAKAAAADPEKLLDSARNGAVTSMNAQILNERKISLGSSTGVAFEAESEKFHFTVRMYVAGSVLYQIMVATPLSETYADTGRFLDSFQLLDAPA